MSQQLYNWNRWIACHAWQIFSTSFVTQQRVFFPTQSSVVSCKIPKTVVEFICFSEDEVHRMSSHFCFFFIYFIVALGKCNIAKRAYRLPWASIAAYTSHRQAYFAAGQRPPHRQPLHVTLSPAHAHWHQHQILSHITDKKKRMRRTFNNHPKNPCKKLHALPRSHFSSMSQMHSVAFMHGGCSRSFVKHATHTYT